MLLVKSIGMPEKIKPLELGTQETLKLLPLAEANKIPLLFLKSVGGGRGNIKKLVSYYESWYGKALSLAALVSDLLRDANVSYTYFKTFKPFLFTPSDVDVLLSSKRDFEVAFRTLKDEGLRPLDRSTYGLTMFSPQHGLNLDLTTEVDVHGLTYLDKRLLFKHVTKRKIKNQEIRTLEPCADLVSVAAHALYKEQIFTLGDYYTFALYSEHYGRALNLARAGHVKLALVKALGLTRKITVDVFGFDNPLVQNLENAIGRPKFSDKPLDLPKKYSPLEVGKALLKKVLDDPLSRESLPIFLGHAIQPQFASKLVEHISRKRY